MGIRFNEQNKLFNIESKNTSYILSVLETGHLVHLYWGRKINSNKIDYLIKKRQCGSFLADLDNIDNFHLEAVPQETPEVVMVYSPNGLTGMSHIYHDLYRERLARGSYRDKERPILINNWEATYFDFDNKKIKEIAKEASDLGIELFVLDDGWFGERNNDDSSLGDWFVNENKIKFISMYTNPKVYLY